MAVSGREPADFSSSISRGSAEDFGHSCEPCLVISQHAEAHGCCLECQEYLCKKCFADHKQMKATKTHQILDKKKIGKQSTQRKDSAVCIDKRTHHGNKTIKLFCTNLLCCTDCITLNHRMCEIEYIPDKCAGFGYTEEYRETMKKLEEKLKELDEIMKRADVEDKRIDTCYDKALQEIIKFRKEINDHLDQLQKTIQAEVDKKKSTDKQNVQEVLKLCSMWSADIRKLKSNLQDHKTPQHSGQLNINIKQAQANLKSDEVKKAEESLARTNTQYWFERSKDLENTIARHKVFGKISDLTNLVTPKMKKTIEKVTHQDDINVSTESDENKCTITGCAILSSHKIVLADEKNCKLKVVDGQNKVVIEEKSLDSQPRDIAVLPENQIEVTIPKKREVLIMSTAGKLSITHRMPVKAECRGITYNQDHLYVIAWNPHCIHISDIQGNVQNTISLDYKIFGSPNYIVFNKDSKLIYLSNFDTENIVSITLQGDVSAVYKNKDFRGPLGMVMLEDGSLLVCCIYTGKIHRITGHLKQGQTVTDGLPCPRSICYSHYQQEVYIACGNQLKVFSLQ